MNAIYSTTVPLKCVSRTGPLRHKLTSQSDVPCGQLHNKTYDHFS